MVGFYSATRQQNAAAHLAYFCTGAYKPAATAHDKPAHDREAALAIAADLRLIREFDASQALKDYALERQATLAKTVRMREARLALVAEKLKNFPYVNFSF